MNTEVTAMRIGAKEIDRVSDTVQLSFERETGIRYPKKVIGDSIRLLLERRFDRFVEDLDEVLTSPHMPESKELHRMLEAAMAEPYAAIEAAPETIKAATGETVFSGFKPFSTAKFGAMVDYFAGKGRDIYKTNLNKLMFYADLTYFAGRRQGISGATYVNLPYGPVPDGYESVLNKMAASGRIEKVSVPELGKNAQRIKAVKNADRSPDLLSEDEIRLLDWILETYGAMSPTEISELSHLEKAYANTRLGEQIAYEYAKFLKHLPPDSFWK